jgi:large subunit ribosomal protein L4e
MKANIVSLTGAVKGSVELPAVFSTEYKPELIRRAVQAIQTAKLQPKGANPRAGKDNTALYVGYRGVPAYRRTINVEHARLPRLKNKGYLLYGQVASVPHAVKGPAAHPLKSWETIEEKINKKEKRLALESAIAASLNKELVSKRFVVEGTLPIIIEDSFEDLSKTKEVVNILDKVGVGKDLENAKGKIRKRAGKGKARGRLWKQKKSVLVVCSKNCSILKAVRNLPGVDSVTVNSLNVELLAPGTEAGRLVVWTEGAIKELGKEKGLQSNEKEKVVKASKKRDN